MKNLIKAFIPDDWQSATKARSDIIQQSKQPQNGKAKQIVAFVIPIITGALIGIYSYPFIKKDVIVAIITISGVLAGFVITLMLFTGRVSGSDSLDYEASIAYRAKITYLLWSQLNTFGSYIITVLICIAWIAITENGARLSNTHSDYHISLNVLSVIVTSFTALSMVRTYLLPYQIYEVHKFSLDALVKSKEKEINYSIDDSDLEFED